MYKNHVNLVEQVSGYCTKMAVLHVQKVEKQLFFQKSSKICAKNLPFLGTPSFLVSDFQDGSFYTHLGFF